MSRGMEVQMTQQAETVETKAAEPKAKRPRQARSVNVRFDGQGESLHVRAFKIGGGGWRSEAIVATGTGKKATRQRGMSAEHADEAAARVAVDKLVQEAQKAGWVPRPARSFARKPDAFAATPRPQAKPKK